MKSKLRMIGAVVLAITLATSAYAQSNNRYDLTVPTTTAVSGYVTVSIPFDFTVAGVTLPAGNYTLGQPDEKGMILKSVAGARGIVALTNPVAKLEPIDVPKLVFHKYGDRYFLAQTWLRCSNAGREFIATKDELKMARTNSQEQVILMAAK